MPLARIAALREWCPLPRTATTYIKPGLPSESPFIESFDGRVCDELLNFRGFDHSDAQVTGEGWPLQYNT